MTGYSHPKCYARSLEDCDHEITKEHYISESVLAGLGGKIVVTRARLGWDKKPIGLPALASNMLCKRHNNALSGLDDVAKRFVPCLLRGGERTCNGGGRDTFNGYDVELWFLKVLCGYTCLDGDEVPDEWLRILFGLDALEVPAGLHMNVRIGETVGAEQNEITFETAYSKEGERVGCAITMHGYRFLLGLDGKRVFGADELGKESVLRPVYLRWMHAETRIGYRVEFAWPHSPTGAGITVTWAPMA